MATDSPTFRRAAEAFVDAAITDAGLRTRVYGAPDGYHAYVWYQDAVHSAMAHIQEELSRISAYMQGMT